MRISTFLLVVSLSILPLAAQERGDSGRGSRSGFGGFGGDRGGFGGDRGGPSGGFGGPSGSFGGPPGGFGGRGGFGGPSGGDRGGFGGPPGGDRGGFGGPPGGGRSMLDTNNDGRIDQDEIARMPQGFRDMMAARGITMQPGMSVDDFRNTMREQFSQGRDGAMSPFGGPRPGDPNSTSSSPNAPFIPKEKERVTIDLPPKYSELDTDFDGQIGMYEWLLAKRESLDLFDQIDIDEDGLLTPAELQKHDEISSGGETQVTSYKRERLVIVGGSVNASSRTGATASKDGKSSSRESRKDDRAQHEESARRYFGFMDRNRDGQIGMEEWEQSRRLRPTFEEAGIKIEAMSESEFVKKYVKAMERSSGS